MGRQPKLKRRIAAVGGNQVSASASLAGITPATPMETPAWLIAYTPVQNYPWGPSGTLTYQDLEPLWTADGGYIPAVSNGGWGPVHPAGRP
jgi:hypothetical protein